MNQSRDEYIANHQENAKDKRQSIFSRGSRACQHATSRCVDQHLVVRQLRGVSQTSSTRLATTRTYPQVRYLNDTSNLLELPFGAPSGKVQHPHNHRRWPRTITNSCQSSSTALSHLGGGTTKSNKRIPQRNTNTKSL